MSMNDVVSGERVHIGFFGCRNAGKSSLVNAVTAQELSVVSSAAGTTTDPVKKSMELLPIGPVVIVDTPGFDDTGALGEKRVARTRKALREMDLAVLVIDGAAGAAEADRELIALMEERRLPFLVAWNKADLNISDGELSETPSASGSHACRGTADGPDSGGDPDFPDRGLLSRWQANGRESDDGSGFTERTQVQELQQAADREASGVLADVSSERQLWVSAKTGAGIEELKRAIGTLSGGRESMPPLVADLINAGDLLLLVVPIDAAAPKGRLILPQQQTIRNILDADARALVVKEDAVARTLAELSSPPAMVITDSQVFGKVAAAVPPEIKLTSFSILMARHKGFLSLALSGAAKLDDLADGDKVLICEGCTHHRQCGDIGTEKLPRLLKKYTKKELRLEFISGKDFPEDLSGYALVMHCGGCMLTERGVCARMEIARAQGVPVTNYGTAIAQMNGILRRALSVFPGLAEDAGL